MDRLSLSRKGPASVGHAHYKGYEMHTLPNGLVEIRCGRDSCPFHFASSDPKLLVKVMLRIHPRFCKGRDRGTARIA